MSFTGRPPFTVFYTWAALLTVLQVHLWEDQRPAHSPAPAPPSTPPCKTCFRRLLRRPLIWRDKALLDHLRGRLETCSPTLSPWSALSPEHPPWAGVVSYNTTETFLRSVFASKRDGVFVEVGAQDGLWLSNTWWLEAVMGWRGLLIEADPHNYMKLRTAPRAATTFQGCVTPSLLTTQEVLVRRNNTGTTDQDVMRHQEGHTKLQKYATESDHYAGHTFTATCYPLISLLLAAKLRKIDLLTFDVAGGGFEMMQEFLESNKRLGNIFEVKAMLYQDNELPQFFTMDSIKEQLQDFGYGLLKVTMDHYFVYSGLNIKVVDA
ncbi:uncharacterized protein LOC135101544 [Scylla paramamosain]|uniref:uncharacterized protein LOC135101544 n=1 Tax=Scylla paramamosain TaxID=85552 RepID=UPI003082BCAA